MRKEVLLVAAAAVLTACSKAEAPKADTTASVAPAGAPAPPPPPKALTAADIGGTWKGEAKPEGKDSVVSKWTITMVNDSTGKLTYEGTKTSVTYSVKLDADSLIAESQPYIAPGAKVKTQFHSVGWLKDGTMTGHASATLASKPDSVVSKVTWTATKAP